MRFLRWGNDNISLFSLMILCSTETQRLAGLSRRQWQQKPPFIQQISMVVVVMEYKQKFQIEATNADLSLWSHIRTLHVDSYFSHECLVKSTRQCGRSSCCCCSLSSSRDSTRSSRWSGPPWSRIEIRKARLRNDGDVEMFLQKSVRPVPSFDRTSVVGVVVVLKEGSSWRLGRALPKLV